MAPSTRTVLSHASLLADDGSGDVADRSDVGRSANRTWLYRWRKRFGLRIARVRVREDVTEAETKAQALGTPFEAISARFFGH